MTGSRPSPFAQSRLSNSCGIAHLYLLRTQVALERGNGDGTAVEHAGGQRAVEIGIAKDRGEVFHFSRASRSPQRHFAKCPCFLQLGEVVATANAIAVH